MSIITYREALNQAIDEELTHDEDVILIGEEVAEFQGAYKVSQGLLEKYGKSRIIDTPIVEEGFTGLGIGAAMLGLRPIVEFMTFNFSLVAIDQIVNNAAKLKTMSGGQISIPIVFRGPNGPAEYLAAQHSQSFESIYSSFPGLHVVYPSNPYDAKGLLKTAIRSNNPVIFLEGELMYSWKGEVPSNEYLIPFGKANIINEGEDITILTYGRSVQIVNEAVELLSNNFSIESIDLRSIRPLDTGTIFNSVKKTNNVIIVTDSLPISSFGSYIAYLIQRECFDYLDSEVRLISTKDVPIPYSRPLEIESLPSTEDIVNEIKNVLK